LSNISLLFMM